MKKKQNGSAVFMVCNGELVLILRDDKPTIANPCRYALLGGGRDPDDADCFATIIREINEETSLSISQNQIKKIGVEKLQARNAVNYFFVLFISKVQFEKCELYEGQKMECFSFEQIKKIHELGDQKFGLGGAIYRFMCTEPDIVQQAILGTCNPFLIERE